MVVVGRAADDRRAPGRDAMPAAADDNTTDETRPRPAPGARSPVLIAVLAYGLLLWMLVAVLMLIAWRLSGG
jgi:hypothetical protein